MMTEITIDKTLDCRGLSCPMPLLKVKKAMKTMDSGQVLEMLGTDPGTKNDIEKDMAKAGHSFLGSEDCDGYVKYLLQKG